MYEKHIRQSALDQLAGHAEQENHRQFEAFDGVTLESRTI